MPSQAWIYKNNHRAICNIPKTTWKQHVYLDYFFSFDFGIIFVWYWCDTGTMLVWYLYGVHFFFIPVWNKLFVWTLFKLNSIIFIPDGKSLLKNANALIQNSTSFVVILNSFNILFHGNSFMIDLGCAHQSLW